MEPRRRKQPGRRLYRGIRGKTLDFIEHKCEGDVIYLHIRFTDKTEVSFVLGSKPLIKEADLSDISTGDYRLIREYIAYEE